MRPAMATAVAREAAATATLRPIVREVAASPALHQPESVQNLHGSFLAGYIRAMVIFFH